MTRFKPWPVILAHFIALSGSLGLAILSGQNPRIILYGLAMAILLRFLTVWLFATDANGADRLAWLREKLSRTPAPGERSHPYRDQRTRKMAGLPGYLIGIFTLMFMIGVLQAMGSGTGFLRSSVLQPELVWGLAIACIYWCDDLLTRQIVIHPKESTAVNFGYNVSAFNFMLAAIFISAFLLLVLMWVAVLLFEAQRWRGGLPVEWLVLSVLALIRFAYDIREPEHRYPSGRRLPG